jgi:hypothetical protein
MIKVKNVTVHYCEQGSDEWLRLRAGRIGGTSCAELLVNGRSENGLGAGAKTLVYRKAAEHITGPEESYMNDAMARGVALEPVARRRYEDATFTSVEEVGYISKGDFLGVSPDGIIGFRGASCNSGGIEIKCPGPAEFVRYMDTRVIKKEYYYQCQWAMYLTGAGWWDFVYFHPGFGSADLIIERQYPDEKTFSIWDAKIPVYVAEIERVLCLIANEKSD